MASGKGGVGKSTTACNLALALKQKGNVVGLLDADIYGPSLPLIMGVKAGTRPQIKDQKLMIPINAHGIECNSMGFLVDAKTAMVWRAPMIVSAFNQMLSDTAWSDLEYLIVDMPPGTGDIQLSLAQSVRVSGAVIVTTPQDVALLDSAKCDCEDNRPLSSVNETHAQSMETLGRMVLFRQAKSRFESRGCPRFHHF